MYGRIHSDIFNLNKFLLNNMSKTVRLIRGDDEFSFIGEHGYRIEI